MSKGKPGGQAAESPSPRETVCVLLVHTILDGFEDEICCQRADGVDRVFSTSEASLRAERPSESTLADSVETLLPGIIARCWYYYGEPVVIRGGLLSKERVEAIISSVRIEMDETKKANEVWRAAEIVTKAAQVGLSPQASSLHLGTWIARCPGTNHPLEMQPKRNLFYCGYCKVGGGIKELDEFTTQRKEHGWRKNQN